jgi:hypothetical protein
MRLSGRGSGLEGDGPARRERRVRRRIRSAGRQQSAQSADKAFDRGCHRVHGIAEQAPDQRQLAQRVRDAVQQSIRRDGRMKQRRRLGGIASGLMRGIGRCRRDAGRHRAASIDGVLRRGAGSGRAFAAWVADIQRRSVAAGRRQMERVAGRYGRRRLALIAKARHRPIGEIICYRRDITRSVLRCRLIRRGHVGGCGRDPVPFDHVREKERPGQKADQATTTLEALRFGDIGSSRGLGPRGDHPSYVHGNAPGSVCIGVPLGKGRSAR